MNPVAPLRAKKSRILGVVLGALGGFGSVTGFAEEAPFQVEQNQTLLTFSQNVLIGTGQTKACFQNGKYYEGYDPSNTDLASCCITPASDKVTALGRDTKLQFDYPKFTPLVGKKPKLKFGWLGKTKKISIFALKKGAPVAASLIASTLVPGTGAGPISSAMISSMVNNGTRALVKDATNIIAPQDPNSADIRIEKENYFVAINLSFAIAESDTQKTVAKLDCNIPLNPALKMSEPPMRSEYLTSRYLPKEIFGTWANLDLLRDVKVSTNAQVDEFTPTSSSSSERAPHSSSPPLTEPAEGQQ